MPLRSILTLGHSVNGLLDEIAPRQMESAIAAAFAEGWRIDPQEDYCPRCGASIDASAVTREGCPFCHDRRLAWHRLTRLTGYAGPPAGWIKAMKFGRQWRFGPWFGRQLAEHIPAAFDEGRVIVVPVPLHWWRRAGRGYDQSRLIAEALGQARGWPVVPVLRRYRHAKPQSSLSPSERLRNVRRCFKAADVDLTGYQVVLVDDVKTTGATLSACARLLRKRHAKVIHAAVVAVADPNGQRFEVI